MTEKQYGGASSHGFKDKMIAASTAKSPIKSNEAKKEAQDEYSDQNALDLADKYKKAGKIAAETIRFAKSIIKPEMPLIEIAEKIESKIIELGGKPAFPTNLSINEIAAHSTPSYSDLSKASGLLKVDLGVQIDGCVADTAFSWDLDNSEENKKLIEAAELALKEACKTIKSGVQIREIGKSIEQSIKSKGFQPIQNLSGHSIEPYDLHAGIVIPNIDNTQDKQIIPGIYAIEPFATSGLGQVKDGKPSGIFSLKRAGNVRDPFARQVLEFIAEEYQTLPFCTRWLYKKFGSRVIIAMQRIEEAGLVHQYPQLIESGRGKVAQAEHTIIVFEKEKEITTSL